MMFMQYLVSSDQDKNLTITAPEPRGEKMRIRNATFLVVFDFDGKVKQCADMIRPLLNQNRIV